MSKIQDQNAKIDDEKLSLPSTVKDGLSKAPATLPHVVIIGAGFGGLHRNKGNLATVGRSFAVLEMGKLRLTGFVAWVMWLTVHIFYLIGFRNRFLVFFQWMWAYFTFQRGTRLITFEGEPRLP